MPHPTRREFIKISAVGGSFVAAGIFGSIPGLRSTEKHNDQTISAGGRSAFGGEEYSMAHELPPLPYAYDAFTTVIDEQTMRLHHDIHHNGYVTGLNKAEQMLEEARNSGDFGLVKYWQKEIGFHGSGHALHTIFWNNLSPDGGGTPSGEIGSAINRDFGSFDKFSAQFKASTNAVEGSGWGILAYHKAWGKLVILQVEKHHDVTVFGAMPLLVVDVWEHAYYLKYQNKRPEYTKNIFDIFNWDDVEQRLADSRG